MSTRQVQVAQKPEYVPQNGPENRKQTGMTRRNWLGLWIDFIVVLRKCPKRGQQPVTTWGAGWSLIQRSNPVWSPGTRLFVTVRGRVGVCVGSIEIGLSGAQAASKVLALLQVFTESKAANPKIAPLKRLSSSSPPRRASKPERRK
jgi:hypothetical protein